jgi:hypothetical protein
VVEGGARPSAATGKAGGVKHPLRAASECERLPVGRLQKNAAPGAPPGLLRTSVPGRRAGMGVTAGSGR